VRGRDAVAGWCRWVGAVQGAQVRRCRRTGAGVAELRRRRPSPPCAAHRPPPPCTAPPPPSLPLTGAASAGKEKGRRRLGFRAAAVGFLWGSPSVREWLRPGALDGRVGTRGGIAAATARG
jgi:hypothetical protein